MPTSKNKSPSKTASIPVTSFTSDCTYKVENCRKSVHANPQAFGVPHGASPDDYFVEFVAHTLAYQDIDKLDKQSGLEYKKMSALINAWGYDSSNIAYINDKRTGFQALRLDPLEPVQTLDLSDLEKTGLKKPSSKSSPVGSIVAFRGTEVTDPGDIAADLIRGIGSTQFSRNKKKIFELIGEGKGLITLTGHSLGGALAQLTAVKGKCRCVSQVVGFQSPGIARKQVRKLQLELKQLHSKVEVRFHSVSSDLVSAFGEHRLRGTFFTYRADELLNRVNPYACHTSHLMYKGQKVKHMKTTVTRTSHDNVHVTVRNLCEGTRDFCGGSLNMASSPMEAVVVALHSIWKNLQKADSVSDDISAVWDGSTRGVNTFSHGCKAGMRQIRRGARSIVKFVRQADVNDVQQVWEYMEHFVAVMHVVVLLLIGYFFGNKRVE